MKRSRFGRAKHPADRRFHWDFVILPSLRDHWRPLPPNEKNRGWRGLQFGKEDSKKKSRSAGRKKMKKMKRNRTEVGKKRSEKI